jgi:hypothetical protein
MPEHDLMERIYALVQEHGTKWKTVTEILHTEGYKQDDGSPLTVEIVRQRYRRGIRKSGATLEAEQQHSQEKEAHSETTDPEATSPPLESPHKTGHTSEAMVPVGELLELFKGTIERRDAMLAQKLKAGDEKQYAEDRILALEARLEERLLTTLKEQLAELVADLVGQEFKSMLASGGSFGRDLKILVDKSIEQKFSAGLAGLLGGVDVSHEHRGGPGRGHKDKRTARFSATMDGETYSRMKDLGGTFSSRLTAACQLYLRALESKREHT